jgi:hypothetical protein
MQIAFIGQKKTEHGAKKKELESVARPEEDQEQMSVKKERSKLHMMKELEMQLRASLGKVNADLVSPASWQNLRTLHGQLLLLLF